MKWITREHVHVDRTACPWLIRKVIDAEAEFLFVPQEKVSEIAQKEKAIPFDAPGVELGHHGDMCSFDAIIGKYKVTDPALLELAKIVRAADTSKPGISPEGAGLDAVMTGISFLARGDLEAVDKAGVVYDALYTFCKLRLVREEHREIIGKMDRQERREFLREKLKQSVQR